jgi:hypothetical protein
MSGTPEISYWHLWLDEHGVSHHARCAMTEFQLKSIGGGADAQWQGVKTTEKSTVMFTVLPVGWVGDWHPNPKPQWIIPLSGRWSVEAMDGTRVEMGPGDVSYGDDVGAKAVDGKAGHYSTTVGDAPAVLMLVQFEDKQPSAACPFK